MVSFAERVIAFNTLLEYHGKLPEGIRMLNPFAENEETRRVSELFYRKYYSDNHPRTLILGINPGRHGAGATGIPFTDTGNLKEYCGIEHSFPKETREPSSEFVYRMIEAMGGPQLFYSRFYINSLCPLALVKEKGKTYINYNYYDSRQLADELKPFIVWNIRSQIELGCNTKICFCLGRGKNYLYLSALNDAHHFFEKIIALDHPRFIIQYKRKELDRYISEFTALLGAAN